MMALFRRTPRAQETPVPVAPTDVTKSGNDPKSLKKTVLKDLDKLAILTRKLGRDIPPVVYSKIRSIDDTVRPLMDYIERNNGCSPEQEHLLRNLVPVYIMDSVNTFVGINPQDRKPGSEPEKMVSNQFDTMERKANELDELIRSGAMDALLSQGFFLEAKFER